EEEHALWYPFAGLLPDAHPDEHLNLRLPWDGPDWNDLHVDLPCIYVPDSRSVEQPTRDGQRNDIPLGILLPRIVQFQLCPVTLIGKNPVVKVAGRVHGITSLPESWNRPPPR